jgi:hypothetical protein
LRLANETISSRSRTRYQEQIAENTAAPLHERPRLTPLDRMTRRFWHEDPARLVITLASYRLVAALMGGRHDVAEFGCANPFGARLTLPQFKKLTLFDPRRAVVDDLQLRFQGDGRFEARVHDIRSGPLPRRVDSAYSIDFLQYVSPDDEDIFIRNMRDSLPREFDFLLIGSPTLDGKADIAAAQTNVVHLTGVELNKAPRPSRSPQPRYLKTTLQAEPAVVAEAVALPGEMKKYWRTPEEVKALAERYFYSVFIFSMIDSGFQPGLHANAQHVFALGCGKR